MVRSALDLLAFGVLLLIELIARSLPLGASMAIADATGSIWYALDRRRRRYARENLAVAAHADLPVPRREALVHQAFRNLARIPLEVLLLPRLLPGSREMLRRCRFFGDWPALHREISAGRGGLFVSGHVGNWEVAGWGLAFLRVRVQVVARPLANRWINARATRARGGFQGVIAKAGAVRRILQTVREGGWVGIVGDQNAGPGGVFLPFFGLPASTHATPAVLALRERVPLFAGACLRREGLPMRFDLHVRQIALPERPPDEAAVRAVLEDFTSVLEGWVRLAPEQYNWVHRRWKVRPPGETDPRRPSYADARRR